MTEESKWEWNHFIPSWDFNRISLSGYAQWGYKNTRDCAFVMMENIKGVTDSRPIAVQFDDIATGQCCYRDWTSSGLPFTDEKEVYWSGFWFEKMEDAVLFQSKYGGSGNWQPGHDKFVTDCNNRR